MATIHAHGQAIPQQPRTAESIRAQLERLQKQARHTTWGMAGEPAQRLYDSQTSAAISALYEELAALESENRQAVPLASPTTATLASAMPAAAPAAPTAAAPPAATSPAVSPVATPAPQIRKPLFIKEEKWSKMPLEQQATTRQLTNEALVPLAGTAVQLAAAWPATAAEKEAQRIRDEYKPGQAGAEAVKQYRQASGSKANVAMATMQDTMHTLFASMGQRGARAFTQAGREAQRGYLQTKAQEESQEAAVHRRAEEGAKGEYMQALATPTAGERRRGQLAQVFSGGGPLAEGLGAIQAAQALKTASPLMMKLSPEDRALFEAQVRQNPGMTAELMAYYRTQTTAESGAQE